MLDIRAVIHKASMTESKTEPTVVSVAAGVLATVVGAITATLVYLFPEGLRAPAWVAYAACSVFVFAGVAIVAGELGFRRGYSWLVAGCLGALLVPGAWIALGPGARQCTVWGPIFGTAASDAMCRAVFGAGAVIVGLLLVWVLVRAVQNSGNEA